jgi:hypothetical protein
MSKLPVNIKGTVFEIEDRNLVEGIKSLHSSIEKLKSERAELRKRDISSSELVERVHRHCEARGVIRKVGQCPVEAILTSHSDHVGMVEQLNEAVETLIQVDTDHERHMCKMLLRMMRGQPVELSVTECENLPHTDWHDATHLSLNTYIKYRIPVKKLNIPWEHIKSEYKFGKINGAGQVFVSDEVFCNSWSDDKTVLRIDEIMHIDTDGIEPMTTCERPE